MAEVLGTVIQVKDDKVVVEVKLEQCETCSSHAECAIVKREPCKKIIIDHCTEELKIGDRVEIGTSDSRVAFISFFLYIFPVIFLVSGALIAFKLTNSDVISGFSGIISAAAAFAVIFIVDRKYGKHFKHKITRVIK